MHTTNYRNTLILVAPDTRATSGRAPAPRTPPSGVQLVYEQLVGAPYAWTSDDLLFEAWATRKGVSEAERGEARAAFFAKPQACMRAHALSKTHGWGVHFDAEGRAALVGMDTEAYRRLEADPAVTKKPAMRSRR